MFGKKPRIQIPTLILKTGIKLLGRLGSDPIERPLLLFVGLVKGKDTFLQLLGVFGVQILFAFHSRDHDGVRSLQLRFVVLVGPLDALNHKIFGNDLLNVGCMGFLGRYPAGQLLMGQSVLLVTQFRNQLGRLFDGGLVFEHLFEAKLVGVNATGDLAMSEELFGGEGR